MMPCRIPTTRVFALVLIALVVVVSTAVPARSAVDPFYQRLYEDGIRYAERGDLVGAREQLRLACFGMLDEPPRLVECLARLALAQDALDDSEGFLATVDQLTEAERLHGAWSRATLDASLRASTEAAMARRMPDDRLDGLAGFAGVTVQQRVDEVRALPLDERRRALDRELALAPESRVWRQLWAELELESGQFDAAVRAAETVLERRPEDAAARCVRGRARSSLGDCSAATFGDLDACPETTGAPARLRCLIVRGDWSRADALLETMPAAVRESETVRELERRLRRERRGASLGEIDEPAPPTVESHERASSSSRQSSTGQSSTGQSPTQLSSAQLSSASVGGDQAALESAWSVLEGGRSDQFADSYLRMVPIAERRDRSADVQLVTGLLAFSLERWDEAITYFARAEALGVDRADARFRHAVALYKVGRRESANQLLERCLPQIRPSPYVKFWSQQIRESAD